MKGSTVVVEELLTAAVEVLRGKPALADELRRALSFVPAQETPLKSYMTVKEYAEYVQLSKRTIENLLRRGLPVVGRGRLRRVPVTDADAWMRQGMSEDALERRARLDARRSAMAALKAR